MVLGVVTHRLNVLLKTGLVAINLVLLSGKLSNRALQQNLSLQVSAMIDRLHIFQFVAKSIKFVPALQNL